MSYNKIGFNMCLEGQACSEGGSKSMSSYFIYYTEANVVCIILFSIMLFRDIFNVDRQEKQIKYDHALVAFMLYFACDILWAGIIAGVLPKNYFTVLSVNFGNYVLMAVITYNVLRKHSTPMFLARYGGDEFILIVHPVDEGEIAPLIDEIREQIQEACRSCRAPYVLSVGAGYSALSGGEDTFQLCQQRADQNLYLDKARQKAHR